MSDMEHWKDRVALVTGASSGTGRAIARELARNDMRVAICARRKGQLQELQKELARKDGKILSVPTDLRDESQIMGLFDTIRKRWGGVDVLVNNAGLGHNASLVDGKTDDWREMFELNVLALSICTREAIKDMRQRRYDGYVIHISSMSGYRQVPSIKGTSMYMYNATKYAVRALTEGLRRELREMGSGIRVSAISPGVMETEWAAKFHKSEGAAKEIFSGGKVIQPEDIASMVKYLLSCPPHIQIHDILVRYTTQEY